MKRREFLKLAGGFTLAQGVSGWVAADGAAGQPLFVVVFLRGGADGLHLVAPSADPLYVAARPADLRVLDSGDKAGGGWPIHCSLIWGSGSIRDWGRCFRSTNPGIWASFMPQGWRTQRARTLSLRT